MGLAEDPLESPTALTYHNGHHGWCHRQVVGVAAASHGQRPEDFESPCLRTAFFKLRMTCGPLNSDKTETN